MEKLIIDESRWLRDEGTSASFLLRRSDSKMCCLGFYALQCCGYTEKQILGKTAPSALTDGSIPENSLSKLLIKEVYLAHNTVCEKLICANDEHNLPDEERKEIITDLFKQIDVEVEFVKES